MDGQSSFVFVIMLIFAIIAIVLSSISLTRTTSGLTSNQLTLLENLENNTNITSSGCISAKCFTDDYVKSVANASSSFFSTSEGNVTCQSLSSELLVSESLDNTGILTIGDTNATEVNIGQSSITTTILGDFVSVVPFGSIYQHLNQNLSISNVYTPVFSVLRIDEVGKLVEFEVSNILQYKGTRARTFTVNANLTYTMPPALFGQVLFFSFGINGVPISAFFKQDVFAGDLRWTTTFTDLVFLTPLDNINVIMSVSGSGFIEIGGSMTIQAVN
jgi:hypothetical protein